MKSRTKYLLGLLTLIVVMAVLFHFVKDPRSHVENIINVFSTTKVLKPNKINEQINLLNKTLTNHSYMKSTLRSAGKMLNIFVHYKGDLISDSIISGGTWEGHLIIHFEGYIKTHPGIQMLDIGCNLGVYTLTAAALGCRVVAVDANPENSARVMQSLIANGLQNNAMVCLNAVSDVRKRFIVNFVASNIGHSVIKEVGTNNTKSVEAIFMDDLVPLFNKSKEVMIKIDIEGSEISAFKKASKLFDERNVTFVMIEWEHIKKMPGIQDLINFLTSRHFTPCTNYQKTQILNVANFMSWPYDVFWIK